MSQTPITVTYSLEEVLSRIERKIDKLDERIDKLDDKIDKLTVEVATCITSLNNLDKRVEKIEGTQKNQVWTLITLLGGSLIAVGFRGFFMGNNP
ncbi:hemolysin XhlA family protein [Limnofasciculus baicalensis]|uniref:Hemolysin XhlA family protein n=1 Tax=Limnofasciculus baicalensis BBK-W-15 TaxID=2699891 RepID=A0AAE3KLA8_9CYAN|nr:hemolysin XhlA family protein [Limnofasciculus baicalensis]MCP2727486.1 hemolysin XhlA family protein [Limnofasciculus baicalensis BBK-W-15]